MKKEDRNQNGDQPSDKPSKELIKPSKKGKKFVSQNREGTNNSTAKDPKLGNEHTTR